MSDQTQLWNSVLSDMEASLSRANFSTWFRNTYIAKQEDGIITVAVPNEFVKEWLSTKFHKMILKSLRELSDGVRGVEYIISKGEKKGMDQQVTKSACETGNELPLADLYVDKQSNLNPKYTFETFIIGSFNNLAYAASQAIINKPGSVYNPFFVYGGTGVGKTHLIQAIGNHLKQHHSKNVIYLTSEKFLVEYISSLQNDTINIFKEKYRSYDTLIMDDIQFLSNKEKTQEELFHVFNTLYDGNKQIIFSSDMHPNFIPGLEARLKSRFNAGMIVDITQPEYEARSSIFSMKAKERGIVLDTVVVDYLASTIEGNIRELEGVMNTITCHTQVRNGQITIEDVKMIIKGNNKPKSTASFKDIIKIVAGFYNIDEKDIYEKTRRKEVVKPRQVVMYLLREDFNASYPLIGKKLGGRDHTTVMHSYEKMRNDIVSDDILRREVDQIRTLI
ncbi:MAG: chromosomal replication initiator protein DnaA [Candidatus Yonathbacteria bacterium]|nr:chromosomal replication initiator protein DnaA [Candidatus Yonathbacteria bacterium]